MNQSEKHEYLILNIGYDEENDFIFVRANPVQEIKNNYMTHRYVSETIKEETPTFIFFDCSEKLYKQLNTIGRAQAIWKPDMDDFFDVSEESGKPTYIYMGDDEEGLVDEDEGTCYIPNCEYKKRKLLSQYYRGNWEYQYLTFALYVRSLAEEPDVDNFFEYLFDDPSLHGKRPWQLDSFHKHQYEMFLKMCDE